MILLTNKKRKTLCNQILSNYVIAKDALKLADMPTEDVIKALDLLVDNTISLLLSIGGNETLMKAYEEMQSA